MKKQIGLGLIAGGAAVFMMALMPVIGDAAVIAEASSLQGNIVSISEDLITIASTSIDNMQVNEVDVQITDETKFDETASLESLEEGDAVTIEYTEEADQKIATHVTRMNSPELSQQVIEEFNS